MAQRDITQSAVKLTEFVIFVFVRSFQLSAKSVNFGLEKMNDKIFFIW